MLSPSSPSVNSAASTAFLAGGGEMGERMRAFDWSTTPLGPPATWPQSLKTCVRIILTSRQPMFVWWGEQLINLYNDAYKSIVGGRHPEALGQPAKSVWREIWNDIEPRVRSSMGNDEGTYDEALLLLMERNGYREETYYTFSYSPVPHDHGGTGGIICANTDDTQKIVGERQMSLLRELAARTHQAKNVEDAAERAASAFVADARDIPFALVYLEERDGSDLLLAGVSGIERGHRAAPERVKLSDEGTWPFAEVLRTRKSAVIGALNERFGELPAHPWDVPPARAVVLPIVPSGGATRTGVLIVGLNPVRLYEGAYEVFLGFVAAQLAASLASAHAYEREHARSEELAALDRAKTAFFGNVSHEFRTPLTLMLGPIEDALGSSRKLDGENLEVAYRNALRLLKLVNALLDFSRIEAGRARGKFQATDLAALTTDLASAFRSAFDRARLTFDVEAEPLSSLVYVDRDMWEGIVLNLLSNALKFTFEGTVGIALRESEEHVVLEVTDTGIGVSESDLPHLFERFRRVEGVRARTHEGSGIGLAMVHELVRLHGGTIGVDSTLGRGTAFKIRIPKGKKHLPADRIETTPSKQGGALGVASFVEEALRWLPSDSASAPSPTRPAVVPAAPPETGIGVTSDARVLLADDNADMRAYLGRLLRERWTVEEVGDGAAALAAAKARRPDLVLTDVMMPELDGFGLLRELRSDPATKRVPVIMLSARAGEEARVDGLEAGADDYLVKPFSARELLARVATHLQIAKLREAAEVERKKLYDLFAQAPVPVAVLATAELRHEVANAAYCEMVGRDIRIGQPLREAFPELADHEVIASVERVFATGQTLRVAEMSIPLVRRGAQREAWFNYVAEPTRDCGGVVTGVMVVATEVTEQVVARRRVDALRAAAEDASRAKDEFLSTLSHELRTPLNAIIGWSSLLTTNGVPEGQREKAYETIERNARLQSRLVEELLDLSRIEQGKLVLSVGPVEMVRVVEAAIEAVRPAADAKGVRLQPVLDSHATIVGDPDRLQQIVWNLLSNAIKFTPRTGRVQVRLRREQSYVEVVVADTGQGIDADFLPHAFDRFRQGDGSFTRKAGGLGLGLAIVRSLVELHGGTVAAESEGRGCGATFTVRLPMAPLRADDVRPRGAGRLAEAPTFECPPALAGLAVLVVDDEPETRELLDYLISQCDAHVTTAAGAEEALSLLKARHFDVLLSDVGMPGEDGHSLIRKIRELPTSHNGRIPALALTAYARGIDRSQALRAGFNMHLAKPIAPSELLDVMAALVRDNPRESR